MSRRISVSYSIDFAVVEAVTGLDEADLHQLLDEFHEVRDVMDDYGVVSHLNIYYILTASLNNTYMFPETPMAIRDGQLLQSTDYMGHIWTSFEAAEIDSTPFSHEINMLSRICYKIETIFNIGISTFLSQTERDGLLCGIISHFETYGEDGEFVDIVDDVVIFPIVLEEEEESSECSYGGEPNPYFSDRDITDRRV